MPVTAADFQYVREIVAADSALALGEGKQYLIDVRLGPVAEREGLGSVTELINRLRRGSPDLRRQVVEAMATHETMFFRDAHPFAALRDHVLPELLRARAGRPLSLWSAAASTGQEAYSLALLLREHFPELPAPVILATDISSYALARGERARYSQLEVGRGLPAALLVKHFDRDGREWQLHDEVRRMVRFGRLNLAQPLYGVPPMDVVFLRNVLIYFEARAKTTLLEQLTRVLRPGGYLFLGGAESVSGLDGILEAVPIGRSITYRRSGRT
jgi:chemotaxis protein methyltransferase CheR